MDRRRFCIFLGSACCCGFGAVNARATASPVVEYTSTRAFAPTLARLIESIEAAGLRIFAHIDHAAGAREAGLAMPPTVLLIYGHPKAGTPIMLAAPRSALDLPLRVLVREDEDGSTRLSFYPIAPRLRESGVPEELAVRLEPAQRVLLDSLRR